MGDKRFIQSPSKLGLPFPNAFCDLLARCMREINPSGMPGRYCGERLCKQDESLSLIDSVALFRNKFLRHSSPLFFMFRCVVPRLRIKKNIYIYHYQLFVPRYHGAATKVKPFYVVVCFLFFCPTMCVFFSGLHCRTGPRLPWLFSQIIRACHGETHRQN